MRKNKFLYLISVILVILFLVIILIDYSNYDASYSAPFSADILVRTAEFLLPSIVIFFIAKKINKKH